jgi:hypothetical protein
MSFRDVIEHALRAYYVDGAEPNAIARELLAQYDAGHRAEVLREAATEAESTVALFEDSDEGAAAAGAMEGLAIRFRRMARETEEKSSPAGADATPAGPTGRVAQLLDAIRTARGRWTTVTAFRFYRDHIRSLDHLPNTQLRAVARGDLRDLAVWGHLIRHEEPGRQYYTLKTRKDVRP